MCPLRQQPLPLSRPTVTTSAPTPPPSLAHFIAYALHLTRLTSSVTYASLYFLQRLKTRFIAARGSSGHRLFISAFMIAFKVICDDTSTNRPSSLPPFNRLVREIDRSRPTTY